MTHTASQIYFGMSPMWISTCVLLVTYAVNMSEKVNCAMFVSIAIPRLCA